VLRQPRDVGFDIVGNDANLLSQCLQRAARSDDSPSHPCSRSVLSARSLAERRGSTAAVLRLSSGSVAATSGITCCAIAIVLR
jgi:hypothetical protein